jgi:hypothetical protein
MLLFDLIDALGRKERDGAAPGSSPSVVPPAMPRPFAPGTAAIMPMPAPPAAPWPPTMQPPFGAGPAPWPGMPIPRRPAATLIDLLYRHGPPMLPRAGALPWPAIPLSMAAASTGDEAPVGAGEPTADRAQDPVEAPMTGDAPIEPEEPPQLAQAPNQGPTSAAPNQQRKPAQPGLQPAARVARTIRRGAIEIPQDDGSFEIRKGGTRSWRNNNPGNIAYGKTAIANGALGKDEYGTAIFPTEEVGRRAALATLQSPTYQAFTLDQAIAEWAPSHENDTARYQRFVQSQTGLAGDTRLNTLTQP